MSPKTRWKNDRISGGTEGVEQIAPREAVEKAGAKTELLAPEGEQIQAFEHLGKANTFPVDKALEEAREEDYHGLLLPASRVF